MRKNDTMRVTPTHPDFIMPTKGTNGAGAYDIYMPVAGCAVSLEPIKIGLGFAAEVPEGYVALILPRSSTGAKFGLELNNTCGVIDSDYRGEWIAVLKTKSYHPFRWEKGDRVLQFLLVPVISPTLVLVDGLSHTDRGTKGFGSTGS